jgi:hypothetical protein
MMGARTGEQRKIGHDLPGAGSSGILAQTDDGTKEQRRRPPLPESRHYFV